MSPDKLVDENDPSTSRHVGCQDKGGPGKIHEVILVIYETLAFRFGNSCDDCRFKCLLKTIES